MVHISYPLQLDLGGGELADDRRDPIDRLVSTEADDSDATHSS